MKLYFSIIAIVFILLSEAYSQDDEPVSIHDITLSPIKKQPFFKYGISLGYNRSLHKFEVPAVPDCNCDPDFSDATGNGYSIGLSIEYLLGTNISSALSNSSIIGRIMFETLPAITTNEYETTIPGVNNTSVLSDTENPFKTERTLEITYSLITVETMLKYNVIGCLGVVIGPSFSIMQNSYIFQKESMLEPSSGIFMLGEGSERKGYKLEGSGRGIIYKDGEIFAASKVRLGIKGGIQYEIDLDDVYIVPAIYYNFGITKLKEKEFWRIDAIQLVMDFRF